MKNGLVTIILFLIFCTSSFSQETYKVEDFGLTLNHGGIDFEKMTKGQMDTIVICPINYEDQIPDICVYSDYQKEIFIYINLGNGMYGFYKNIPLQQPALKIEPSLPKDYPVTLSPFYDLKVTYTDGTEYLIYNKKINSFNSEPEPRVPRWNFLNDARVFVYDFTFVKSWQSERNGQPQNAVAIGDIDNDGKNEMVYTFFPVNDSIPQYTPARMVVFESIGRDQFRIDWDTIMQVGGNLGTHILTDFDRNGNKEFFAGAFDPFLGYAQLGVFECSGEGKYRFWAIDQFFFQGPITDVVYCDTMKIINSTKNPGVWINYYPSGFYPNYFDKIYPYIYNRKYEIFGFGHYEFKTLPDNAVNFIRIPWQIDDIDVADIDRDGKDEIVLGYSPETIDYMDSTGISNNLGYERKEIIPEVPLSGGWIFTKDFDGDGYNEIISCGVGVFTGSIGIVKHTGTPGENQFTTMWWDTTGLIRRPNWGIDTGTVNNQFTVLYPMAGGGFWHFENIHTFARDGIYSFYKSSMTNLDTTSFIQAKFFDIDRDNEMDIIAPTGFGLPPVKQFLCVFKMKDIITNSNNNSISNITTYKLNQNYPNPFNPKTIISYELGITGFVSLKVFDIRGKQISTLVNQKQNSGRYNIEFDGSNLSSGIYFYSLTLDGKTADRKKMIYLK